MIEAPTPEVCPETTAPLRLPCATSQDGEIWRKAHDWLKAEAWEDPLLVKRIGGTRLGGLVFEVGHCLSCGSTLYKAVPAPTVTP